MSIFISWSKDRSHQVAQALRDLLDALLPDDAAVVISEVLPKGSSWFENLAGELENAQAGILCVTPENVGSPWLLFEAGALIRCDREVRLYPVLFDVEPTALDGPLALLQATSISPDPQATRREVGAMLNEMEARLPYQLTGSRDTSDEHIGRAWDEFHRALRGIEPVGVLDLVPSLRRVFERKSFNEPFEDCTNQRWLDRHAAAAVAVHELDAQLARVSATMDAAFVESYRRLRSIVDGYGMSIAGNLLTERQFERDEVGRLIDASGALVSCDLRRRESLGAYRRMSDPSPPVFPESYTYDDLPSLEERKRRLIHPLEHTLARASEPVDPTSLSLLDRAVGSHWTWDRIVAYLMLERAISSQDETAESRTALLHKLESAVEREFSLIETVDAPDTLVPLYYALRAVERATGAADLRDAPTTWQQRFEDVLRRAEPSPTPSPVVSRLDANGKVTRLLERLVARTT